MSPQETSTIETPAVVKTSTLLRNVPQQARSRETLRNLMIAAHVVLADPTVGRDEFTAEMIAGLAGVATGTFYRYFRNKTAILKEVWGYRTDTFMSPYVEGMYDHVQLPPTE